MLWTFRQRRPDGPDRDRSPGGTAVSEPEGEHDAWRDRLVTTARAHGAMPYDVEGFFEVSDAVRRGHTVLLRREKCEVAPGVVVFDSTAADGTAVSVCRFDPSRARYVLHDPADRETEVELTPKRLQRYLAAPDMAKGIAVAG